MLRWLRRVEWLPLVSGTLIYVLAVELMSALGFPLDNQHNKAAVGAPYEVPLDGWWPTTAEEWTALFTFTLTASTIGLWFATYRIASNANESSKTLIDMERPYVTGGGDFENEWGKELFRLDVENHGKTAAFMTGYDLQFAKLADLQKEQKVRPVRENKFRHIDGISPQGARKVIRTQRKKPCGEDAVFGAIYYRDIFDRPHHSRFILRIALWRDIPGEGLTRLDVKNVSSEYWSWDIPKNEQT
jgi:hypothetical protein